MSLSGPATALIATRMSSKVAFLVWERAGLVPGAFSWRRARIRLFPKAGWVSRESRPWQAEVPRMGLILLDRKYLFEYDVGLWTFGSMQVLRDKQTKELVTCKTIPKSAVRNPDDVFTQLLALKQLQQETVSSVKDVLEDQSNFYVLSEKLAGNDVADWVVRVQEEGCWLQEQTVANYIRQTLIAVAHGHSFRIVHRDLRPSSLALTSQLPDASVKVCDIGLYSILDPSSETLQRNPGPYTAPEIRQGNGQLNPAAADVWSVGAIAHALLVGHPPDRSVEPLALGPAVLGVAAGLISRRPGSDVWSDRTSMSRDFVQLLLRQDGNRPTAACALQHPWLKGVVSLEAEHRIRGDDVQQRLICYMLAVLLVPSLLEYRDIYKLREAFDKADSDTDGFVGRPIAERILKERGLTAVTMALEVADVRGTGVYDIFSIIGAFFIATEFFAKEQQTSSLNELVNRMSSSFFLTFGPAPMLEDIRLKINQNGPCAIARDLETHAGVDYEEVFDSFPEDSPIDRSQLLESLAQSAGYGTLLKVDLDIDGADESDESWGERLHNFGLGLFASSLFQTCGMDKVGDRGFSRITATVW
ncbi:unnamed protein product [Polarella glacialis]|uniref:Protein kinase domain-containing protein n=1 Tax=Polarella glacialis TaxID=89957 RepID=A0A813HCR3_POLGL|nr:unnamed protein product [Polarella glacialis]